jgi:beta-galactosidase/beta-glucuronidase
MMFSFTHSDGLTHSSRTNMKTGINEKGAHEFMWYWRQVSDIRTKEEITKGFHLILRCAAVDYEATICVDDRYVGSHRGGHVPFDLDVTDAIEPGTQSFVITIHVRDSPHDLTQPRGKQYWKPKPEAIFYTPTSGIWQSVWLESLPPVRIGHSGEGTILRSDDIENGVLHAKVSIINRQPRELLEVEVEAFLEGVTVSKKRSDVSETNIALIDLGLQSTQQYASKSFLSKHPPNDQQHWKNGVALWSPEGPTLYGIKLSLRKKESGIVLDTVTTYAGMRSINWNGRYFKLNGSSYFQALVLDQGYWPNTGLTPPSPDSLRDDIILSKEMGFNGCRKHQKVEDPIFLHLADTLGFLVWGEMANAYKFDDVYMERFNEEWIAAVRRDINHPSVVAWTPVNESWGYDNLESSAPQRNHIRALYFMTK